MKSTKEGLRFIFTERFVWTALIVMIIGIVIGVIITIGSTVAIKETSTNEFCGTCHSHIPIINAFKNDIHGGNNDKGFVAECVDCHLPHDSSIHYLYAKTKSGIRDLSIEFFGDSTASDWMAIREHREEFVYDSGCLTCHVNLQQATAGNLKSYIAHKAYYSDSSELKCVSCHKHVGHKDLGSHLQKQNYQWSTENYLSNSL